MKKAFTLAEVLITLAIIGVVAALTIPTLIKSYNKKVVETKLKKIYSVMNQVILLSEMDNGPKENWPSQCGGEGDISCSDYYNEYILPYIKTGNVKSFEALDKENVAIYFNDGSLLIGKNTRDYFFYPNAKNFNPETFVIVGENSIISRPDIGKTAFAFRFAPAVTAKETSNVYNSHHIGKSFDVYLYYLTDVTQENLINGIYGCREDVSIPNYCTALIKLNNWKIPDDYPFDVK